MDSQLVPAFTKAGEERIVPSHWLDHPRLSLGLFRDNPTTQDSKADTPATKEKK